MKPETRQLTVRWRPREVRCSCGMSSRFTSETCEKRSEAKTADCIRVTEQDGRVLGTVESDPVGVLRTSDLTFVKGHSDYQSF